MPPVNPPLLSHEKNIHSQSGEDGVLAYALSRLPVRDSWCCEIGAWDGKHCSNTLALIENENYAATLIECDPVKFIELKKTHATRKNIHPVCRFAEFSGPNTLDAILAETPIPVDFDLLSIDIDGNDYYLWESLKNFRPKLVVIEFNPSISNGVAWVQPRDMRLTQGASLDALNQLALSKNYRLIHATQLNGIFVDEKYFSVMGVPDSEPAQLRADVSSVTHIFQTYDGKVHLVGNTSLLWHGGVSMHERCIQPLPTWLHVYPHNYGFFRKLAWKAFRLWTKMIGR